MLSTLLTTSMFCALLPLVASVIVSTKYGLIEGLMASFPNASTPYKSVSKFLGIPFAAPPIGGLRLKPPRPPKEWKPKVFSAKKHGNICLQNTAYDYVFKPYAQNFSFSEDCLYIDVYTPNASLSLPVMFYIHGGGFDGGSAIMHPGDILALQGVVVVVIQYRLGALGFFTTGDSAAPGNFGMLDQVEALKWVQENIGDFGGDPNKVTIFGVSAGGMSVGLHLMSPLSKGLFHQAIAESGVELSPIAIQPISSGLSYAKEVAQNLDCTTSNHHEMVACVRNKKGTDIEEASRKTSYRFVDHLQWAPVVDKIFLHDTPRNLQNNGNFNRVPLILSFTSQEGSPFLGPIAAGSFGLKESLVNGTSPHFFRSFLTKFAEAQHSRKEKVDLIADALEFMYTPWPDNSDKYALRSQLVDLVGDYIFCASICETGDMHSQFAPVYMYEFAHRSKLSALPEWMGVAHAENIVYDFGIPMLPGIPLKFDATDSNVSRLIMAMYADFARSPEPQVSGVTWETFNSTHRAYLKLDTNPKMAASFYPRRMAFWNDYYPKLAQMKFDATEDKQSCASKRVTIGTFVKIILTAFSVVAHVAYVT